MCSLIFARIVSYYNALYCIVLHRIALYCIVLHCTALYCIVVQCGAVRCIAAVVVLLVSIVVTHCTKDFRAQNVPTKRFF